MYVYSNHNSSLDVSLLFATFFYTMYTNINLVDFLMCLVQLEITFICTYHLSCIFLKFPAQMHVKVTELDLEKAMIPSPE